MLSIELVDTDKSFHNKYDIPLDLIPIWDRHGSIRDAIKRLDMVVPRAILPLIKLNEVLNEFRMMIENCKYMELDGYPYLHFLVRSMDKKKDSFGKNAREQCFKMRNLIGYAVSKVDEWHPSYVKYPIISEAATARLKPITAELLIRMDETWAEQLCLLTHKID